MNRLWIMLIVMLGTIASGWGTGVAAQRTLRVPSVYTSIQSAIDAAAQTGDTVLVAAGTYRENLDFNGKGVWVRSERGALLTTVDGGAAGPVVFIARGEPATAILEGFTITNGSGYFGFGGGILIAGGSSPRLIANHIVGNLAGQPSAGEGGGVYVDGSATPHIAGNRIAGNRATGQGGGLNVAAATVTLVDNVIEKNTAGLHGGGLISNGGNLTLDRNVIRNNIAGFASSGGGVYVANGSATIRHNRIESNQADLGGGIALQLRTAVVEDNTIASNIAQEGGGIHTQLGTVTIARNTIRLNAARDYGGGIANLGTALIVRSNVIADNSSMNSGGGLYTRIAWPTIAGNTIANNASARGGGIDALGVPANALPLIGNIVWGNTATAGPAQIAWTGTQPTGVGNDVQGGWPGPGNLAVDPRFVNGAGGDYHLKASSPCQEQGPTARPELGATDFEGDPRVVSVNADIGADEAAPHLYTIGAPAPGNPFRISAVGRPQDVVQVGLATRRLATPLSIPSVGLLWIVPNAVVPLGALSADGHAALPILLPATFPTPTDFVLQALIGTKLSNVIDVRIR